MSDVMESKEMRDRAVSRVEVLDKVKELLLIGNSDYATMTQLAEYFEVGRTTLEKSIQRNKEEIFSDGVKKMTKGEIVELLKTPNSSNVDKKSELKISPRGGYVFPKRAILRIAMLLRDSNIAKEIRTRLLDVFHDVEEKNPEIVENVVNEIDEERNLLLQRVEAEVAGDFDKVSVINAKIFNLKNKRIRDLENTVDNITTNKLTIIESRSVINRMVRKIAFVEYDGSFKDAYSNLYSKINYKLNINIKSRKKKKNESYLKTLTEEEIFQVEQIVRTRANDLKLDLNSLLKI